MLLIFKGTERIKDINGFILKQGKNSSEIQNEIQKKNKDCEHLKTIKHTKEGRELLTLKKETILEAQIRLKNKHNKEHLPFDPLTVTENDLQEEVISSTLSQNPREIYISPSLIKKDGTKITIDDFKDGFSFGNGVTANSSVQLKDENNYFLTWCVFPENTKLDKKEIDDLQFLIENN